MSAFKKSHDDVSVPLTTSSEISIVDPGPDSINELVRLWRETFAYHHALAPHYYIPDSQGLEKQLSDYLREAMAKDKPMIKVARKRDTGTLVGFVIFETANEPYIDSQYPEYGVINDLYVTDEYRSYGIGALLMAEAEAYFRQAGLRCVKLNVAPGNTAALRFYERLGYGEEQRSLFHFFDKPSRPRLKVTKR